MSLTRTARRRNGVSLAPSIASTPSPAGDFDQFARALLSAMIEFRDGNFAVKPADRLVGVDGKIADVFNDIVTVSQRRAGEMTRVCRVVGKEGRLQATDEPAGRLRHARRGIRPRSTRSSTTWSGRRPRSRAPSAPWPKAI